MTTTENGLSTTASEARSEKFPSLSKNLVREIGNMEWSFRAAAALIGAHVATQEEVLALRRRNVDLERETITIEHTLVAVPGMSGHPGRGEARTVQIPPDLMVGVRDHLERFTGRRADSFLFASGEFPVDPRRFEEACREARRQASLATLPEIQRRLADLGNEAQAMTVDAQAGSELERSVRSARLTYELARCLEDLVDNLTARRI